MAEQKYCGACRRPTVDDCCPCCTIARFKRLPEGRTEQEWHALKRKQLVLTKKVRPDIPPPREQTEMTPNELESLIRRM